MAVIRRIQQKETLCVRAKCPNNLMIDGDQVCCLALRPKEEVEKVVPSSSAVPWGYAPFGDRCKLNSELAA